MKKSVYLAASINAVSLMKEWRASLVKYDIHVTSSWLDVDHQNKNFSEIRKASFGRDDLNDLTYADVVCIYADEPSTSGGLHVEYGIALGANKPIYIVGKEKPNVFFYIQATHVKRCSNFAEFLVEMVVNG